MPGVRAAVVDGDTPAGERDWARAHATYLLTTPDMLHHSLLPRHARWDGFFRRLRYVIVDECHAYRGVFGSHVAQVLRRLRRVGAHHARSRPHRSLPGLRALPRRRSASRQTAPGCSPGWTPVAVDDGRGAARAAHLRALGAAAHRRCAGRRARRCGAPPPPRRPDCSPTWWRTACPSAGVRAVPARRRGGRARRPAAPGGRRGRQTWRRGWPRTGPAICPRSAAPWRRRCAAAGSPAWPPRARSSWASTSAGSTRC